MWVDGHLSDDHLLDLVLRLAPAAEREGDLRHLGVCGSCAGRLREAAACHERALAREAEAIAEGRRGARLPSRPGIVRRRRRLGLRWVLLAAAALLVVFGLRAVEPNRNEERNAPAVAWMPMPEPSIFLRGNTGLDPRTVQGLEAYASGDRARARRLLSRARETGAGEAVRLLYLGSIELADGRYRRAIDYLGRVDASLVPEPWGSEARWSLALAHHSLGHASAADSLLHLLAARPDEIGARARRLLKAAGTPQR